MAEIPSHRRQQPRSYAPGERQREIDAANQQPVEPTVDPVEDVPEADDDGHEEVT
jgi:hypothetical protein